MPAKQPNTAAPRNQQPASKAEPVQGDAGTKKSSPALMTTQDWIQRELAKAPPLNAKRWGKITQLLLR